MLTGGAFLALWNDVDAAVEDEYNRWHSAEHVAERVSVPGIRSARRYVARQADRHRYFTLYDLDDAAVLASAPYLALVNGPSPWSQRMRPHFRNLLRVACTRVASCGNGMGGALVALKLHGADEVRLADLCALDGVVAAHWGRAEAAVAALPWAAGERQPQGIVLAEATDEDRLARVAMRLGADASPVYRMAHEVRNR